MQEIMEHYGIALLAVIAVTGAMGMICSCMGADGIVCQIVGIFMQSICG
ncbi:MAG: hypothetical protein IKW08_08395 [Roseburia sp.]|nr:hypothetical protein [Roseburia sp.]